MFTNQSADISLDAPCRALDSVKISSNNNNSDENLWIAGTCCNSRQHSSNSLSVIRFHADLNELEIDQTFEIDAAVRCLCCCPSDPTLVVTAPEQGSAATLWKIPPAADGISASLEQVASLLPEGGFGANIVDIAWRNSCSSGSSSDHDGTNSSFAAAAKDVLTLDMNGHLTYWDIGNGSSSAPQSIRSVDTVIDHHLLLPPPKVAWDPHASDAVAVTHGNTVSILDWRSDTSVPTGTVESLRYGRGTNSSTGICDLDYNPNKPYVLATAGQDGNIKFWDLRQAKRPVLTARGGHSHWCQTVNYNPFHDQLVLSTGTDGLTNLWRLSTVSSAPLLHEKNQRVSCGNDANDSIYAAAWGATDAWIYLTVSYDGKAVLSHVPSKEKYKILL